ncbi:curved DNA-binding protein CbpA [Chitinophaga terrae (ex Kim and Jung 2007)]|uniref:J domain-containing protein n=1 Tax=Chitinophaga terrae (ex Kim and Jung 2007) TaxID=408074 RepID=UPI002789CBDD|nr:J domain-containing protein [Chitinophaga terrae (ex Kim and Jung 2007)]MDQ0110507.1 curved DNA-binding protein CbpA [Chitinophaga terrae (ex Kim and Jung 2007)]
MFVDYYSLFEISPYASSDEIKLAFKKQALKWHPDRNPGFDTTEKMQLLNEAKLILLDNEARQRYDYQYQRFYQKKKQKEENKHQEQEQRESHKNREGRKRETFTHMDFDIDDELLKKWTANAKLQAVGLAKQTIEELKGMVKAGIKDGAEAMGTAFISQIILGVIFLILIGLSKSCN